MPPNCRRSRRFLGQPLSRLRLVERICERRRRQFSDDQRGLWHCRGIASFELDLWSRKRNLTRAAFETWLASDEGNKAATIALVAEVANAWLTIGADSEALAIARETLASREATLAVSPKEAQGIGTGLETVQADTLVQSARADVAAYVTDLAQARNALQLLVGTTVSSDNLPTGLGREDAVLASLPVGLDSAVLLRRPDVLAAEHQLRAANANIGAARAAFFPQINLTTLAGLASGSLSGLFDSGGTFRYGLAASATQTLFDGGALASSLKAARASREAAVAMYERRCRTPLPTSPMPLRDGVPSTNNSPRKGPMSPAPTRPPRLPAHATIPGSTLTLPSSMPPVRPIPRGRRWSACGWRAQPTWSRFMKYWVAA
jgi:hypothetical protein